jgi:hypothetical protein
MIHHQSQGLHALWLTFFKKKTQLLSSVTQLAGLKIFEKVQKKKKKKKKKPL